MDDLLELYTASKPLMSEIITNHQDVLDFCSALRYLIRASVPENTPFVTGIQRLMDHQEALCRVATSYHLAIGERVKGSSEHPER